MSATEYELHLKRNLLESLWEDDGYDVAKNDPEDIDKIILEELSAARRRKRRKASSK